MLNKGIAATVIGFVLALLGFFFPDVEQPEGLADAILTVVEYIWSFFVVGAMAVTFYLKRESRAKTARLKYRN